MRNRYYNPSIGRFITEDPIKDGFNWYAYCDGNPVMLVDPLGLESGEFFETYYDALEDWTSIYFPQSEYGRIEMGSALYCLNGYGYAYTEPFMLLLTVFACAKKAKYWNSTMKKWIMNQ